MKDYQSKFIEFCIESKVIQFGEFKLKSGRISPYFFNSGLFNNGEMLQKLGEFYSLALIDSNLEYDVLFGPAYKGIPLVSTLAVNLMINHKINAKYCFNRKEVKDHGEGGFVVGSKLEGKVVVVDDVITAGTAIREVAKIIHENGAKLHAVLIALDRQEQAPNSKVLAIKELEMEFGIKVVSIIKFHHLVEYLQVNDINSELLQNVLKYQTLGL